MIIRVFRAQLKPGARGTYERLCREFTAPLMRAQPGCLTTRTGEQSPSAPDIFVFLSVWTDLDSLRAFVGENWQACIILPGEADLLEEVNVEHYVDTYDSLVQFWHAHADLVKRREITALQAPLTEAQWAAVQPLLPPPRRRGRPRADDRRTLDGIVYVLRNGCRWRDLPPRYGDPVTCWRRFSSWEKDGSWERIWCALLGSMNPLERCVWVLALMGSSRIRSSSGSYRRTPAAVTTPQRHIT
jgi:transposase/quinol monooxygenase YgiN